MLKYFIWYESNVVYNSVSSGQTYQNYDNSYYDNRQGQNK